MRKKIFILLFILGFCLPLIIAAQTNSNTSVFKPVQGFEKTRGFLDNLLNPSRFSMSQSYSLSYTAMGKYNYSQGIYLNTMNYQFSDPLMMQVRIGYMHQPLGGNLQIQNGMNKIFLQRAMLQYKPSENMSITLDYQVLPGNTYSPYYYNRSILSPFEDKTDQ